MPMGVFEVLATMNQEQRQVLAAALEPDDAGRTFITAWLNNRLSALADGPGAEDAEGERPAARHAAPARALSASRSLTSAHLRLPVCPQRTSRQSTSSSTT